MEKETLVSLVARYLGGKDIYTLESAREDILRYVERHMALTAEIVDSDTLSLQDAEAVAMCLRDASEYTGRKDLLHSFERWLERHPAASDAVKSYVEETREIASSLPF